MTVKEWLRQIIGIESRIRSKADQIEKYRLLASRTTSSYTATRVSGTSNRSPLESGVVGYLSAEDDARDELQRLRQVRHVVLDVLAKVEDQRQRDVLEMRYVTGWRFERIASEMNYDVRWIYELHGYGLEAVRSILHDKYFMEIQ